MTDLSRAGDTLGFPARLPHWENTRFLHNQRLGRVIRVSDKMDEHFLYWLLRCDLYRHHVLSTSTGTTVKHTNPKHLKQFSFPLPAMGYQKQRAALLDAIETKIDILEQCAKELEQMVMTIFDHWFTDYQFPGQKAAPLDGINGGEAARHHHSFEGAGNYWDGDPGSLSWDETIKLPPGWGVEPLSAFGAIVCGRTPPRKIKEYFDGPGPLIPFIKIPDLRDNVYVTESRDFLTEKGAATQPDQMLPPHSICVSCIATVGLVALTGERAHTNQQINTVVPHYDWYRYYLYCRLKKFDRYLQALGRGGTSTLNLSARRFSRIRIPKPPKELLKKFHETVHPFFQRILLDKGQSGHLKSLRKSLLQTLLTST